MAEILLGLADVLYTVIFIFIQNVCLTGNDKDGDKVITNHVCQHGGKSWPYWFRKMGK